MVSSGKWWILQVCETLFNEYWNWSGELDINHFKKSTKATGSQRKRTFEYDLQWVNRKCGVNEAGKSRAKWY